jgi:predicted dehydrogenase
VTISAGGDALNVGVIGFGKLGLLHAAILNGLPGVRLAAVADQSSQVLKFLKSKMPDLKVYDDHHRMLREESLGAAAIATPTGSHAQIALDCVNAGLPFMVEKPLCARASQALPLVEALKARPVVNLVGYMTRHQEGFVQARRIIASGALGRLQKFQATMYIGQLFKTGKGWRYDKEASGGGVLITQNSHLIDMLLWLFGELEWVSGHTQSLYSEQVEDCAHAWFKFKSGLAGFLDSSWSQRHYRTIVMGIGVQGSLGTLEVEDDGLRLFLDRAHGEWPAGWSNWRKPDLFKGVSLDIGGPYYTRQAEEFIAAVRGQGSVASDVFSAYRTQCAVEAIYRSASQDGAPVGLESF